MSKLSGCHIWMVPEGKKERGRRGRQPERVAVAIFYNKTHLCVTTTTTRKATALSVVVDMAFELPARSRRGRPFSSTAPPNDEIAIASRR